MDLYARAVLNRLLFHECVMKYKNKWYKRLILDTIEELNNRVNVKNVSEGTMAAVIVRIRKEVTGSYKLKR